MRKIPTKKPQKQIHLLLQNTAAQRWRKLHIVFIGSSTELLSSSDLFQPIRRSDHDDDISAAVICCPVWNAEAGTNQSPAIGEVAQSGEGRVQKRNTGRILTENEEH